MEYRLKIKKSRCGFYADRIHITARNYNRWQTVQNPTYTIELKGAGFKKDLLIQLDDLRKEVEKL